MSKRQFGEIPCVVLKWETNFAGVTVYTLGVILNMDKENK